MQNRQNRCRSDSPAEKHDRPFSGLQNEAPARRADFDSIALPDMLPQVVPGHTIRLNFHTDSIALRRERTRERVAAKKCRAIPGPLETQDDILAGQSGWQFMAVRALH